MSLQIYTSVASLISSREPPSDRQRQNASEHQIPDTNRSRLPQNISFTSLQADRCSTRDDIVQCRTVADSSPESLSGDQCKRRQREPDGRRLLKIRQEDVGDCC